MRTVLESCPENLHNAVPNIFTKTPTSLGDVMLHTAFTVFKLISKELYTFEEEVGQAFWDLEDERIVRWLMKYPELCRILRTNDGTN